jgi:hypothetical protein
MMRAPHFVVLAQKDQQHFVNACRHGVVHLTWERITIRFTKDEFQRLAGLLEQAADNLSPNSARSGNLRVTARLDDECEIQMGSLVLLLSPTEFRDFAQVIAEAIESLERFIASGIWDREEPEDTQPGPLEQIRQIPFSRN